ncbi:NPCBM/NEW2 domain-containing protein [Streptomyces bambusae]|uniref:Glycosyl hydrolase family 98 putative carbohydrate-binding module domain-containing protein n=1 Tax=Streptomyces bambusae TaxID=1550616 RepID=A0ABS6ZGX7_9ACTN|nr:NPCBM/NEW2 domain-containing protein [Streptomyces bambusae]MBW5487009.1 hypothetical protein [Streptomyces bambusae]
MCISAGAKAALAAGIAVAAAAGVVFALAGDDAEPQAEAWPAPSASAAPRIPHAPSPAPSPSAPEPPPEPGPVPSRLTTPPVVPPSPSKPAPRPSPSSPAPTPAKPDPAPTPTPTPTRPKPSPTPPAPAAGFPLVRLGQSAWGDHSAPEVQSLRSSWVWQRWGLHIAGRRHAHGITVNSRSSVEIALNRQCSDFSARVGVDDLSVLSGGSVRFSVYGDGQRLWQSPTLSHGDPAVPVHVGLAGHRTLRLVVEPAGRQAPLTLASWADAVLNCR